MQLMMSRAHYVAAARAARVEGSSNTADEVFHSLRRRRRRRRRRRWWWWCAG
jgi:hypothetical protein